MTSKQEKRSKKIIEAVHIDEDTEEIPTEKAPETFER